MPHHQEFRLRTVCLYERMRNVASILVQAKGKFTAGKKKLVRKEVNHKFIIQGNS